MHAHEQLLKGVEPWNIVRVFAYLQIHLLFGIRAQVNPNPGRLLRWRHVVSWRATASGVFGLHCVEEDEEDSMLSKEVQAVAGGPKSSW